MPGGVRGGDSQWWWYHSRAGFISQRFEITCTSQSLLLRSISPLLLMYITRITLCHVLLNPSSSSCSYSLLHPSSLGPGSDSIFRVRTLAPTPSLEPRLQVSFLSRAPGSDSIFRVRAPGSNSFSRAPAPSVLPLSSPSSVSPFSTFCILPRIEYSSLQFHFDIQQTIYHQT